MLKFSHQNFRRSLFFDIPTELICEIMTRYLRLEELSCLDIACTSKRKRPLFLHCLSLEILSFEGNRDSIFGGRFLRWISSKQLRLKNVRFRGITASSSMDDSEGKVGGGHIDSITDDDILDVSEFCTKLFSIEASHCSDLSDEALIILVSSCYKRIMELMIFECYGISDIFVQEIIPVCKRLQRLEITYNDKITDVSIEAIALHCPNLRVVNISGCSNISDEMMGAMASGLPLLESLNLSDCRRLRDHGIIEIITKCTHLTTLRLQNCMHVSDIGVSHLPAHNSRLVCLDVANCVQISDATMRPLVIACHQTLTELNLSGVYISDATLMVVTECCRERLVSLEAANCPEISPLGLCTLGKCARLQTINVSNNVNMVDQCVGYIAQCCRELRSLNISNCTNVSDLGVIVIAQFCPQLTSLSLAGCEGVTDTGVLAILKRCPLLTMLNISECTSVTDAVLVRLLVTKCCGDLRDLYLNGCYLIYENHERIEQVKLQYPRLTIYNY